MNNEIKPKRTRKTTKPVTEVLTTEEFDRLTAPGKKTMAEAVKEQDEKDTMWRLLNRRSFDVAKQAYDKLVIKHRAFEIQSRKDQATECLNAVKANRDFVSTQEEYEELYAAAWEQKVQLEKSKRLSYAYINLINDELIKQVGWTHEEMFNAIHKKK